MTMHSPADSCKPTTERPNYGRLPGGLQFSGFDPSSQRRLLIAALASAPK